uniref:lytic cellulose monooxygenase (C4-dehydrogenating) n=1 Tax=uncultured eukaryote TaxID=100272 RepID=G8YZS8_9EUKA|nr:putative glycoside hydrolase family 61 [uncultured eukaryote]
MRSVIALLGAVASTAAHGYVQQITAGGTVWSGYLPYTDPYYNPVPQRIVRPFPGNGPVTNLSFIDVQCNGDTVNGIIGTTPAALYATAAAGSVVTLNWTTWPDSHLGPIITYLAKAPSDITKWLPGTAAVWFKVAQSGYSNGTWASTALINNKSIYQFTIPKTLAPGQYIIRHEIIALHAAYTYPGAQVYPDCIQIQVTGSGTASPSSSYLVSFPGAYTGTTPGIVFDVYQGNASTYTIPGPAVWTG